MKIVTTAAVGAAGCVLLLASPASAQAWIGTMVGNMSAQQQEAHCQASRQPVPQRRDVIRTKLTALMGKLAAPGATAKDLAKLYASRDGAKIASATTLISAEEMRTLLGSGGEWKHLVVGADHLGARGVWRVVTPGADGAPETVREFGFDFVGQWGNWKVLRAQEYPAPLGAPDPEPFCHLWETATY